MNLPRHSKTYEKYCNAELTQRRPNIAQKIDSFDLLFDIYRTKRAKSQTRGSRVEKYQSFSKKENTHIYREFNVFMRDNESKTETFEVTASGST